MIEVANGVREYTETGTYVDVKVSEDGKATVYVVDCIDDDVLNVEDFYTFTDYKTGEDLADDAMKEYIENGFDPSWFYDEFDIREFVEDVTAVKSVEFVWSHVIPQYTIDFYDRLIAEAHEAELDGDLD